MNRQELISRIRALNFPTEDYWVVAGGAMVLHGIRAQTHDIDLGCTKQLGDRLEAAGYLTDHLSDGSRRFEIDGDIEIYDEWRFDVVENIEGIPVISIEDLIRMKKALGREKDQRDLARIEEFLKNR